MNLHIKTDNVPYLNSRSKEVVYVKNLNKEYFDFLFDSTFLVLTNLFHSDIITKEGAYEIVGEIEK